MEYLPYIASILLIHILAVMSPGPDFIMAVRNSLSYSRRIGLCTALGIGLGIGVHILYCVAGLALIISKSILLFNTIKLLGAAYLVYIGIKSMLSKTSPVDIVKEDHKMISSWTAFQMGFITNVLNPKATLFFLSLFTFAIKPGTPGLVLGVMSILMIVATTLWFSMVVVFFTNQHMRKVFSRSQSIFCKLFGGLLVAFGIKVALSHK
jgi:RhtB (resistance to homoserine/threonine) family protein